MVLLVVFHCFLAVILSAKAFNDPANVQVVTNHKIAVRSTPSLDPAEEILEAFGSGNKMNLTDMETFFKRVGLAPLKEEDLDGPNSKDIQACFTSKHFYGMYSRNDGNINKTDLIELCPAMLYQLTKKECRIKERAADDEEDEDKEDPTRAWGFGFLFVTIISFGSLIGAFVVPLMDKSFYKITLMCMVSLAVGVLGGSGIFHLIPKTLGLPVEDDDTSFLWKCVMIVVGLYTFLLLECAMKLYIRFRDTRKKEQGSYNYSQDEKPSNEIHSIGIDNYPSLSGHNHHSDKAFTIGNATKSATNGKIEAAKDGSLASTSLDDVKVYEKQPVATVAWMIIIGDGLHNFIDGLAIGASFSQSVVTGISTSLAVICEELPHELGDFAILLNSGFTYKQALLANFLSACCCYVGLVIGLLLGYATSSVKYIYGIAGGMFLYISLVDMLPEAVEMAYAVSGNKKWKSIKMLAVVNFFIVFGFAVMFVLALYGDSIEL